MTSGASPKPGCTNRNEEGEELVWSHLIAGYLFVHPSLTTTHAGRQHVHRQEASRQTGLVATEERAGCCYEGRGGGAGNAGVQTVPPIPPTLPSAWVRGGGGRRDEIVDLDCGLCAAVRHAGAGPTGRLNTLATREGGGVHVRASQRPLVSATGSSSMPAASSSSWCAEQSRVHAAHRSTTQTPPNTALCCLSCALLSFTSFVFVLMYLFVMLYVLNNDKK